MHRLSDLETLLVLVFLVATMFAIGLRAGVAALRRMLASRSLLARAIVANFAVVPLVGFALARIVRIPEESAVALVLLACVPGGLGSVQFTSQIKAERALPGATLVLLNVLALLVSPWLLRLLLPSGAGFAIPYGPVVGFFALWVLLPLGAGVLLRELAPGAAPRLAAAAGIAGAVAFVAFMVASRSLRREAVAAIGGTALGALALLFAASMAAGWLLGGPARETRQLLATATSMRNAALCLAIARHTPLAESVTAPLIAFILLMVPPNLLLTLYGTVRARRMAARSRAPKKGMAA